MRIKRVAALVGEDSKGVGEVELMAASTDGRWWGVAARPTDDKMELSGVK